MKCGYCGKRFSTIQLDCVDKMYDIQKKHSENVYSNGKVTSRLSSALSPISGVSGVSENNKPSGSYKSKPAMIDKSSGVEVFISDESSAKSKLFEIMNKTADSFNSLSEEEQVKIVIKIVTILAQLLKHSPSTEDIQSELEIMNYPQNLIQLILQLYMKRKKEAVRELKGKKFNKNHLFMNIFSIEPSEEELESIEVNDDEILQYLKQMLLTNSKCINRCMLKNSYSDFDWQIIKQYCNNLVNKDFSKIKTVDDLYNYLNDYFEPLQINIEQVSPYYSDRWVSGEIANGTAYSNGFIDVYVDFDSILDIIVNNYKLALKDFCNDLAKVITHEMTHRYQNTQYEDRKWENIKTQQDYLEHKDEISAHVIGGVVELLDLGYSKEDLLKALRTIDSDLDNGSSPFWQSDSIYTYWDNFGSYDSQDITWKQVKKELYNVISNIEN